VKPASKFAPAFVILLVLVLVPLAGAPLAHAQEVPPEAQNVINALRNIFIGIQAVIWIVIGLAWITGNMMWSAPTRSLIIKRAGQQQMELSGIALFLTLMGPGIFAFITFLAQQFGVANWPFLGGP
jgi:predicted ferric reductase